MKDLTQRYIAHMRWSIEAAKEGISAAPLTGAVLSLSGMSSHKVRWLLNNLCSRAETRYLEIGCWKGSTLISALYGNEKSVVDAVAIDNWSQFQWSDIKGDFLANCARFIPRSELHFYEADAFTVNKQAIFNQPFNMENGTEQDEAVFQQFLAHSVVESMPRRLMNVYFYDGDHSADSQERALTYYFDVLADTFILVIDDWNEVGVQAGTFKALSALPCDVCYASILPGRGEDREQWWNGLFVAVIEKRIK